MVRKTETRQGRALARATAVLALLSGALITRPAGATPTDASPLAEDEWTRRYEAARKHLVDGEFNAAYEEFDQLAGVAPTESDRRLALEMARVSAEGATRASREWKGAEPAVPPPERIHRTSDEITLLYTSSFVYGVGTGAWFLLQTQPDSALTATLPFVAIAAAPVVGLAIVDGHHPLPHGVPHGISAGMYLGLGESIWIVGYQHSRSDRIAAGRDTTPRWSATTASSVLWGGATIGAVAGAALSAGIPTTPGRVSFVASNTIWAGALTGFATSAFAGESRRSETALLAAGIGYNAGLAAGLSLAPSVSPSLTRVRLVDMSGIAGGLVAGGLYLSFAGSDGNSRASMGLTAAGAATGLAIGWLATSGMAKDTSANATAGLRVDPTLMPVEKGMALGVAGSM